MDIVEIVTTIAHKIWNCKHFSYHLDESTKSEAKSDFISIFFQWSIRFSGCRVIVAPMWLPPLLLLCYFYFNKLRRCRFFLYGYLLLHWSKATPITVPFDVSYAEMWAVNGEWAKIKEREKKLTAKTEWMKKKMSAFLLVLEPTLAADSSSFRALHFQFGFVFD